MEYIELAPKLKKLNLQRFWKLHAKLQYLLFEIKAHHSSYRMFFVKQGTDLHS